MAGTDNSGLESNLALERGRPDDCSNATLATKSCGRGIHSPRCDDQLCHFRTASAPSSPGCPGHSPPGRFETPKDNVEIVHFVDPNYPPLAQTARVTGDVVVRLGIHKDGNVESVAVVSGSPMLAQAALDRAQHSRYECQGCANEITQTQLVYSFRLEAAPGWPCSGETPARVTRFRDRITVTREPRMISITFGSTPAPAAKCLYLWRCGSQWGGDEYYFDKVRAGKCLNLWKCGRRLREPWATCRKLHREIS